VVGDDALDAGSDRGGGGDVQRADVQHAGPVGLIDP